VLRAPDRVGLGDLVTSDRRVTDDAGVKPGDGARRPSRTASPELGSQISCFVSGGTVWVLHQEGRRQQPLVERAVVARVGLEARERQLTQHLFVAAPSVDNCSLRRMGVPRDQQRNQHQHRAIPPRSFVCRSRAPGGRESSC
jgi:hypothetical protein